MVSTYVARCLRHRYLAYCDEVIIQMVLSRRITSTKHVLEMSLHLAAYRVKETNVCQTVEHPLHLEEQR